MAELTQEQLIEHVSTMTVLELSQLVKALEEKFGVSAAAAVAAAPAASKDSAPAEEKTEFDVILKGFGAEKIKVIKEVRTITGLGLKEAKDLVESAGDQCFIKKGLNKEEAEKTVKILKDVGADAISN